MKKLIAVLFVFTMTVFVACDHGGGGGGSNSNCANNNNATNYAATPVTGTNRAYGTNPIYNTGCPAVNAVVGVNGLPTIPGCAMPQMQNAYQFCQWLAVNGENICDPATVRSVYLNFCGSYFGQFNNYCGDQFRLRASEASHYVAKYDNNISDEDYYNATHPHNERNEEHIPDPTPSASATAITNIQDGNCSIDVSTCTRIRPYKGSISDLNIQQKFLAEASRHNIQCYNQDRDVLQEYSYYAKEYEDKYCQPQAAQPQQPTEVVTHVGPVAPATTVATQPLPAPTVNEPAQTFPLIQNPSPSAPKKLNGCLRANGSAESIPPSKIVDLQHIHEMLMVPSEHSYMRKYINLPKASELTQSEKETVTAQAYDLPMGSMSTDLANGQPGFSKLNFSALGLKVLQSDNTMTLDIGDQHGEIYQCDSNLNYIRVHFLDTKNNVRYDAKISKNLKSTDLKGSVQIEMVGTVNAGREIPYQTETFLNWDTEQNISKIKIYHTKHDKNGKAITEVKKDANLLEKMQILNTNLVKGIYNDPTLKVERPGEGFQRILNNTEDIIKN